MKITIAISRALLVLCALGFLCASFTLASADVKVGLVGLHIVGTDKVRPQGSNKAARAKKGEARATRGIADGGGYQGGGASSTGARGAKAKQ